MMNIGNLIQMLKGSGNPQSILIDILKKNTGNNPILENAVSMAEKGDIKGIETLARNICEERKIDPDDAIKRIKGQFGI